MFFRVLSPELECAFLIKCRRIKNNVLLVLAIHIFHPRVMDYNQIRSLYPIFMRCYLLHSSCLSLLSRLIYLYIKSLLSTDTI